MHVSVNIKKIINLLDTIHPPNLIKNTMFLLAPVDR
jgi:hypothetical protein